MSKNRIIILISIFASLTAVGAYIKIPLPQVPVTLQTFFVIMSGNLIGAKYGAISQLLYLSIGILGAPIFAYGGGPAYVFQPTFGYLLGYPICAFVIGVIVKLLLPQVKTHLYSTSKIFAAYVLADIIGILMIFVFGVAYFYLNVKNNLFLNLEMAPALASIKLEELIKTGFLIFIPFDIVKVLLAAALTIKFHKLNILGYQAC
jgi:biotin transport system substrate-specific component